MRLPVEITYKDDLQDTDICCVGSEFEPSVFSMGTHHHSSENCFLNNRYVWRF